MKPMLTHPNLRVLPIDKCTALLNKVKMPPHVVAMFTGLTRMTAYRLIRGEVKKPLPLTLEIVSLLAYKIIRAAKHEKLPLDPKDFQGWTDAFSDANYDIPLSLIDPADLLPASWGAQTTQTTDQDNGPEEVPGTAAAI